MIIYGDVDTQTATSTARITFIADALESTSDQHDGVRSTYSSGTVRSEPCAEPTLRQLADFCALIGSTLGGCGLMCWEIRALQGVWSKRMYH